MAILPSPERIRSSSHPRSTLSHFNRRNGNFGLSETSPLAARESAALAVVIAVVFSIGVAIVAYRKRQDARQQQAIEAARKRAGKKPATQVGVKFSLRIPQAYVASHPSYLRYWNESPAWEGTFTNKDGIMLGSICSCDDCRTFLDGFS
ncbi:hypothetical protein MPH_03483 [Macrophomina phaseolina MS6]|uniref:Uncharacterized protein n=1 Tax=Macrophomina phaseolina (strain MS6) TaxID=1126212 RepID=K2RWT1_MACPH|nr:hypothetical protein MPH_03483 [Macrophomina phaseolina MS6]